MLSLSAETIDLANQKQSAILIDPPYKVSGCCFDVTECPAVRFGEPSAPSSHQKEVIDGITVFVPTDFPDDKPIVIRTRNLFGFRQLVLDGWKLV